MVAPCLNEDEGLEHTCKSLGFDFGADSARTVEAQFAHVAFAPAIQQAAQKRTSSPQTKGSNAGMTAATTFARVSSSASERTRPTGPIRLR